MLRGVARRAGVAGALLVLTAGSAPAQTGLLVLGGPEAGRAAAVVRWDPGPVMAAEEVPRGLALLVEAGAVRAVVVPVDVVPGDDADARIPVRFAATVAGSGDAAALARRIEARAREVLALYGESHAGPGAVFALDAVNVTATRTPLEVFGTAAPVAVVEGDALDRRAADADLGPLAEIPGVELEGVGPLRPQPVIRGFGGQRVLLLEDGLRLANTRRRVGSVEPAALAGPGALERIEVVRGPASVLYGSDAIGGVVNLVTRGADPDRARPFAGSVRLAGSTAGDALRATVDARARRGPAALLVSASVRSADAYEAPDGRFGDVSLPEGATVHDTGAEDLGVRSELAVRLGGGRVFARAEAWESDGSGFGWIDPELLDGDAARVRLTFPDQRFARIVTGWRSGDLGLPVADGVEAAVWLQDNERRFVTDVRAPLGPTAPPDARLQVVTDNRTDLRTLGVRLEATRVIGSHAVTWGVDAHRDRSRGADTTTTTLTGMGPPSTTIRVGSGVPDATLSSVGVFVQDRIRAPGGAEVTLGARWQDVRATPDGPGSGLPPEDGFSAARHVDRTLVGAASLLWPVGERASLVVSLARGFRSPNLVERFFSGPTPGGQGVWVRNPDLRAETSLGLDLGVRVRRPGLQAELFVFRTALYNGIRLEPTGDETPTGPAYRNENVDELVVRGVEAWAGWSAHPRLHLTATAELQDRRNPDDPHDPLVEGVRSRLTGTVTWAALPDHADLRWRARREGAQRETLDGGGPVGVEAPAWHVHDVHLDVMPGGRHAVTLGVENLFDRLWARAGNIGFFRPEPGRRVVLAVRAVF